MEKTIYVNGKNVFYKTVDGEKERVYIGDYDLNITLKRIEKDFDEMVSQCGSELDAKDRDMLFSTIYLAVKGCLK